MERSESILAGIDIDSLVGLEIGPLDRPLVLRTPGRQIFYADYAPASVLRDRSRSDPNRRVEDIPETDYVIAPLPQHLDRKFDYIVASHVGEHVPDFLGWLKTLFGWLNKDGQVILALPDKRYTFDCKRQPSTVGDFIEAFMEKRDKPSVSSIYDGFSQALSVDGWYLWEEVEPPEPFPPVFTKEKALQLAREAFESGEYRDCHCWVFTAEGFKEVLDEVKSLGLIDFEWSRFVPGEKYSVEFFASLRPVAG